MCGLIGGVYTGGWHTVHAVAAHSNIAVLDMTRCTPKVDLLPIRTLVQYSTQETPARCAIILRFTNEDEKMYKVAQRLTRKEMNIDHNRIVFCITDDEANLPSGIFPRLHFPGTQDDRTAMLMYLVPSAFASPDENLCGIARTIQNYAVFEPNLRHLLRTDGTPDAFFQSVQYEVAKRSGCVVDDDRLDDFPAFELKWRRELSTKLQQSLKPSPDVTASEIHRVLPVGVLPSEALTCFQAALPLDLERPYVLTVYKRSSGDGACGSIAITQPTQHIVVNIRCTVDPAIMVDVVRELRVGYKSVVRELSQTKEEMNNKLSTIVEKMDDRFCSLHNEIGLLKALVADASKKRPREAESTASGICSKKTCFNVVEERFKDGELKKQCMKCLGQSKRAKKHVSHT